VRRDAARRPPPPPPPPHPTPTHPPPTQPHPTPPPRPQRWSLHYELQLFERVLRHTQNAGAPPPGAAAAAPAGAGAAGGGAGEQHPFAPHAEWSLAAVASIMRCLHGLQVRRRGSL
jgi:hypothetical protein